MEIKKKIYEKKIFGFFAKHCAAKEFFMDPKKKWKILRRR